MYVYMYVYPKKFTKFLGGPSKGLIVWGSLVLRLKVHTVRYATASIALLPLNEKHKIFITCISIIKIYFSHFYGSDDLV